MMDKTELVQMLDEAALWTKDRFSNYHSSFGEKDYRLKLRDRVVRLEIKIGTEWHKLYSEYYTKLNVSETGGISFNKRFIKLN